MRYLIKKRRPFLFYSTSEFVTVNKNKLCCHLLQIKYNNIRDFFKNKTATAEVQKQKSELFSTLKLAPTRLGRKTMGEVQLENSSFTMTLSEDKVASAPHHKRVEAGILNLGIRLV